MRLGHHTFLRGGLVLLSVGFAGCVGRPIAGETEARRQTGAVGQQLAIESPTAELPKLSANSGHAEILRFAVLNSPKVRAAYFEWARAVQRITVERSLPDPRLTFEADITDMVESLMPGLMVDLPGSRKLALAGAMAAADAQVNFHQFAVEIQQVAFAVKKAYYQLYFLDTQVAVNRRSAELMTDFEQIARRQNEVGKVTLQDVLKADIERDQMLTEVANLEDSRGALVAQYKAALGLPREAADPVLPAAFETTSLDLDPDRIWATAQERNPRLKAMAAEVRAAEAALRVAQRSRVPDFSVGIEADFKASPLMVRPSTGMTLPIWRDKIAADIAAAQAAKKAGEAKLQAEQIMLAADLAEKWFMLREANRNAQLYERTLLPKAQQALEVARASYLSGRVDFFNVIDASRTLLSFELKRVEARTQRELALAELALLVAGESPVSLPQ